MPPVGTIRSQIQTRHQKTAGQSRSQKSRPKNQKAITDMLKQKSKSKNGRGKQAEPVKIIKQDNSNQTKSRKNTKKRSRAEFELDNAIILDTKASSRVAQTSSLLTHLDNLTTNHSMTSNNRSVLIGATASKRLKKNQEIAQVPEKELSLTKSKRQPSKRGRQQQVVVVDEPKLNETKKRGRPFTKSRPQVEEEIEISKKNSKKLIPTITKSKSQVNIIRETKSKVAPPQNCVETKLQAQQSKKRSTSLDKISQIDLVEYGFNGIDQALSQPQQLIKSKGRPKKSKSQIHPLTVNYPSKSFILVTRRLLKEEQQDLNLSQSFINNQILNNSNYQNDSIGPQYVDDEHRLWNDKMKKRKKQVFDQLYNTEPIYQLYKLYEPHKAKAMQFKQDHEKRGAQ